MSLPPHDHTIEPGEINRRGCARCEMENAKPTALGRVIATDKKLVALELPAGAIQLLYEVLGHFPHKPGSWSNDARARCSVALMDAREAR